MHATKDNKKGSILVVDDQQNNLKVISSVLSEEYYLNISNSGKRALKILERKKPDLILLDIMMPEMDGYEVCQKIKQNPELREIPIIFLTAKVDIEDVVKGFDYGAVDYITKPFNIKEVKVRIQNHLNLAYAKIEIIEQKTKIENYNQQLQKAHNVLKKRNAELVLAQNAIEEHTAKIVAINRELYKSEYDLSKSENNLKQTNAELTKSIKEKDKFFSIIAHDLKSPFNGLLGLLEIMNNNGNLLSEKEKSEMLSALYQSSKNVYSLVENLLEWSRIQQKSIEFKPGKINLNQIVKSSLGTLTAQALAKHISLKNELDDATEVFADVMMINTVFRNIVSNAIKFTNEGGFVKVKLIKTAKGYKTFGIEDNGIGMSPAVLGKLFRIDEHVTRQGTAKEKGTGLGLILCKEFVEKHGGKIWVESKEGQGSAFYFTLPEGTEKE